MTTTHEVPVAYPFNEPGGLGLHDAYRAAQRTPGMIRVQLPHGEPAWLATRHADARLVLGDPRFSRAVARDRDEPRMSAGRLDTGILSMDPPEHTRLRRLVATAFTVRRVEEVRPRARRIAEELVDAMVATGPPTDLVEAFALPLPVAVICELLGVPVEDRGRFRAWSDDALSTSRLTAEEFMASREAMRAYMSGLIALRRAAPADDLMTALVQARDSRDRLSEEELVELCMTILVAGHETTASQIPNFVCTLFEHPAQLARLRDDESLLAGAVEELMRFVPLAAGAGFPRYATEDVEVGGTLVRAGEPVVVAVGAANRDALRFGDADELRIDRAPAPHIGFGHGAHHCLGAALARMELQEALRVLLARLPGLHLAGDIAWKSEMLVRGAVTMPVGW